MAIKAKLNRGKEFEFAPKGAFGAGAKYKWKEWFNGELNILVQGTDAEVASGSKDFPASITPQAMMPKILTASRKRMKLTTAQHRIRVHADGSPVDFPKGFLEDNGIRVGTNGKLLNAVILKSRDMMEDEKQAEMARRKEEKERRENLHAEQAAAGIAPTTDADPDVDEDDDEELEEDAA